jgi:hypothetical protein
MWGCPSWPIRQPRRTGSTGWQVGRRQTGRAVGNSIGPRGCGRLGGLVNSVQHQVCSILFLFYFYFYFPFLFQIQFKPCLISKFQIYAQEKLHMMHNFYIIFIYSVTLFIYLFILFRLGFQHEVQTPHYYFECVVGLKVY